MKIIISPSWKEVVSVYIGVLQNPRAGAEAHDLARAELMRLAEHADAQGQPRRAATKKKARVARRRAEPK